MFGYLSFNKYFSIKKYVLKRLHKIYQLIGRRIAVLNSKQTDCVIILNNLIYFHIIDIMRELKFSILFVITLKAEEW
jgi:hypothetical protein